MNFLRQILILALMSTTAWAGMPQVACRCSDGKILLHCPRLNQSVAAKNRPAPDSASASKNGKSCCCAGEKSCCRSSLLSNEKPASCCADSCRCTPVYLQSSSTASLKKVSVPQLLRADFQAVVTLVFPGSRIPHVDVNTMDTSQRVPDDLILLCERWLV